MAEHPLLPPDPRWAAKNPTCNGARPLTLKKRPPDRMRESVRGFCPFDFLLVLWTVPLQVEASKVGWGLFPQAELANGKAMRLVNSRPRMMLTQKQCVCMCMYRHTHIYIYIHIYHSHHGQRPIYVG